MKRTYHLCLSGRNEILFRCKEDFIRAINCLCLASAKTHSALLAYAFMSNHVHICVRTEDTKKLFRAFWYPYQRYFSAKYGRQGHLGEKSFYQLEIEGLHHLLTAIAYILRNPMHHGVCGTPFGYEFSSIQAQFRKDLGWVDSVERMPSKSEYNYIPNHHKLPKGFTMNTSVMITPESSIDVKDVEHQFSTARTFLYYMNRLSGEAWEKEQLQDENSQPPINLEKIESGITYQDVRTMLGHEHGRSNYDTMTDIQLCSEIDNMTLPKLKKKSIYYLDANEKSHIVQHVWQKYHIPISQIRRCLDDNTLVP